MHQTGKFRYGMVNSLALVRGFYMRRFATRMEGSLHSFSLAASRGRHFFVGQIGRLCRSACRTGFDLIGFLFYMAANRTRPASVLKDMHTGRVFYWAGRAAALRLMSAVAPSKTSLPKAVISLREVARRHKLPLRIQGKSSKCLNVFAQDALGSPQPAMRGAEISLGHGKANSDSGFLKEVH